MSRISLNCSIILEFVIVKKKKREKEREKERQPRSWTKQLGTPNFYDNLIYCFNFGKHQQ